MIKFIRLPSIFKYMKKRENIGIYLVFLILYAILGIYSYGNGKAWTYDSLFSIALLTFLFFSSNKLKIGRLELYLINIGIILHLAGFFGAYSLGFGFFQWDNIVHIFNGGVVAWIIFNFFSKTFEKDKNMKKLYDEHKVFLLFLVISVAVTLGAFIELTEFGGFVFLGPGEGLFFAGSGDTDGPSIYGDYADTMDDQVSNVIGALIGTFVFYKLRYKKR